MLHRKLTTYIGNFKNEQKIFLIGNENFRKKSTLCVYHMMAMIILMQVECDAYIFESHGLLNPM